MKKIEKVIKIPFSTEELRDFMKDKSLDNTQYVVNYKESDLRDSIFLYYITNLEISSQISLENCSYEQKAKLIKAYMDIKCLCLSPMNNLILNVAKIILDYRGAETLDVFINPCFTDDETKKFIDENKNLVKNYNLFVKSTVAYAFSSIKELEKSLSLKKSLECVNDQDFIGWNVVHLFSIPSFLDLFFSVSCEETIKYFEPQFEKQMFQGKSFYYFYFNDSNDLSHLFFANVLDEIDIKLMNKVLREAEAILEI